MTNPQVIVMADGGSRGNPGQAGSGAIVLDATTREILAFDNARLGIATNNVAEYTGLVLGLRLASGLSATHVAVQMDSKLVVEQMSRRWRIKHPDLIPLFADAQGIAQSFAEVTYTWIPRAENKQADHLANQAMDGRPAEPLSVNPEAKVRNVKPTAAAVGSQARFETHTGSNVARLERTAALAAKCGIDGAPREIAELLRAEAPEDLVEIWSGIPSARWLTEAISAAPLSWRRGQRSGDGAA
jgi:ribonuclease HI